MRWFRRKKKEEQEEHLGGRVEFHGQDGRFVFVADETHTSYAVNEEQFPGVRVGRATVLLRNGQITRMNQSR